MQSPSINIIDIAEPYTSSNKSIGMKPGWILILVLLLIVTISILLVYTVKPNSSTDS